MTWTDNRYLLLFRMFLLGALLFLMAPLPVQAAGQDAKGPAKIEVGIFVVDVTDLDLKSGSYFVDFYLWFRWKGKLAPTSFDIMNGQETVKERNFYRESGGVKYAVYRCQSRIHRNFSFEPYPLDSHVLSIWVEDAQNDTTTMIYVPDMRNSKIQPSLRIPGWDLGKPRCYARPWIYPTNYGDPTTEPDFKATYSRFTLDIPIHHGGIGIYMKNFLALFISVAIAFLAVFVPPDELEARLGLGVAAIFAVVSLHLVIAQNLPETPRFTLADKLHVVSILFVFIALALSCVSFYWLNHEQEARAMRLDRRARIWLPGLFALCVLLFSIFR